MVQSFQSVGVRPRAIIVMGVSASGKSTIGALLADRIGCPFFEGDAFHSEAAIAKMSAGQPLNDEDRWPWLDRVGGAVGEAVAQSGMAVAACSALKAAYRARLAAVVGAPVAFVMLKIHEPELRRRIENRPGHYMPPSLLASQLAVLEEPGAEEPAVIVDARQTPEEICRAAWSWIASPAGLAAQRQAFPA